MSKVSKGQKTAAPKGNTLVQQDDKGCKSVKISLLVCAVACLLSTLIFNQTQTISVLPIMIGGMAIVVGVYCFLAVNKKLTTENIVILLFAAGFIMRLGYALYTPLTSTSRLRQHDLYAFGSEKGHSGYIEHFYNNGFKLTDFDPTTVTQFYHPPLHHFIAALWMRLLTTFGMSYERAITSLQFLSLFYSCCCMFVTERILRKINLKGIGVIIGVAIAAFHPTFILLSGSVNNDILSILFFLLSIFTTLKWYKDPTTKNILLIALSIGLGMMTKLSVALVAPPVAIVFLIKLVQEKKKRSNYVGQYCAFGCVCIPLGMWFSIRNFIKFDVPFNYVQKLSETSEQYIGNYSVYERLFDYSYHPFDNVFLNRLSTGADYYEYNPFVAILKTSLFGEYNFADTNASITPYCRILLCLNVVMIIFALCTMVYYLIKKNNYLDTTMKIFFCVLYAILMINFITFCFQYPHNCSMDYRYIVPTLVIGAMFIAIFAEQCEKNMKDIKYKVMYYVTIGCTTLFSLFSIIVYMMLSVKTQ